MYRFRKVNLGDAMRSPGWRPVGGALLLVCAIGLFALRTTPGAIAQTAGPVAPGPAYDPAQVTVPVAPPSARAGRPVFLENCAPCHGETGDGDGPSASGLNAQPTIFADPASVWGQQPAELFFTTKYGRMQAMMPPWSQRLDDATIWNAVAYAWSLHTTEQEVQSGQELYAANCASCHGDTGKGDGPDAIDVTSDFSDPASAIFRSQNDWDSGWTQAHPEVGQEWSSADRGAVLEYVRTFTQSPPWVSPYQAGAGVIRGSVEQGTQGGAAVISPTVKLNAFLGFEPVATFTTTLTSDGSFAFEQLGLDPNLNYIASVGAGGTNYSSSFINLSPITPTVETGITVFDTTSDASAISVERLHWILEIEQGALLVGQIYALSNDSDRTFVGSTVGSSDVPVTFAMQVPPGAQDITFDTGTLGERFKQVGPAIYDTLPIPPGQATRQVIMRYVLPYEGTTVDLAQELLYPAAEVSMLVSDLQDLKVNATGLTFQSIENMGNLAYQFWGAQDAQPGTLGVSIEGLPEPGTDDARLAARQASAAGSGMSSGTTAASSSAGAAAGGASRTTPPPLEPWTGALLAGIVTAVLIGALLWARATGAIRSQSTRADLGELRDELLLQTANLDDMHALGLVSDNEFMRKRSQLKAQLLDVESRLRGASQNRPQPA